MCRCGKSFTRLDNLRQHATTIHADEVEANEELFTRLAAHMPRSGQRTRKPSTQGRQKKRASGMASPSLPPDEVAFPPLPMPLEPINDSDEAMPPALAPPTYSSFSRPPPVRHGRNEPGSMPSPGGRQPPAPLIVNGSSDAFRYQPTSPLSGASPSTSSFRFPAIVSPGRSARPYTPSSPSQSQSSHSSHTSIHPQLQNQLQRDYFNVTGRNDESSYSTHHAPQVTEATAHEESPPQPRYTHGGNSNAIASEGNQGYRSTHPQQQEPKSGLHIFSDIAAAVAAEAHRSMPASPAHPSDGDRSRRSEADAAAHRSRQHPSLSLRNQKPGGSGQASSPFTSFHQSELRTPC